jgi:hypothetical protein
MQTGVFMSGTFTSAEFLGSTRPAQAQKCRQMADEAGALMVATTDPQIRATYLDLKQQWGMLADETEQISELNLVASS